MNSGDKGVSKTPEISVVIPMHNVEKYIARCIESVLAQTFQDFELIIVDDGSTDGCLKICKEYAHKDERLKVTAIEDNGVADARNLGTTTAVGKYIAYIDSDDFVSSNYLETLHDMITLYNADIAVTNFERLKGDETLTAIKPDLKNEVKIFDRHEALYQLLGTSNYLQMVTVWGKLIRADIAKNHLLPSGRLHEDEATSYLYYLDADRIAFISTKQYGYYQHKHSIMHSERNHKRIEDEFFALTTRAINLEEANYPKEANMAWLFVYGWLCEQVMLDPKSRMEWKDTYDKLQNAKCLGNDIKAKAFIYMHFPYTFRMIQKIRGKA